MVFFLPMYHSFGLMMMLTSLFEGHTIISMRKYEMNAFLKHIKTYQVNAKLRACQKTVLNYMYMYMMYHMSVYVSMYI